MTYNSVSIIRYFIFCVYFTQIKEEIADSLQRIYHSGDNNHVATEKWFHVVCSIVYYIGSIIDPVYKYVSAAKRESIRKKRKKKYLNSPSNDDGIALDVLFNPSVAASATTATNNQAADCWGVFFYTVREISISNFFL